MFIEVLFIIARYGKKFKCPCCRYATEWYSALIKETAMALCHPMDCSPPGSSVPRILQARVLESVTILFSRGSS